MTKNEIDRVVKYIAEFSSFAVELKAEDWEIDSIFNILKTYMTSKLKSDHNIEGIER